MLQGIRVIYIYTFVVSTLQTTVSWYKSSSTSGAINIGDTKTLLPVARLYWLSKYEWLLVLFMRVV